MLCQTCGGAVTPDDRECAGCYTPVGAPAVHPGVRTYAMRGIGIGAAIALGVTVLFDWLSTLAPVVPVGWCGPLRRPRIRD